MIIDDVIDQGEPSAINQIVSTTYNNPFVSSKWFMSADLQENIEQSRQYLYRYADLQKMYESWEYQDPLEEPQQEQEESCYNYDNYSYDGECIPLPSDDYFYCNDYSEPVDFDYSILNDIYETR